MRAITTSVLVATITLGLAVVANAECISATSDAGRWNDSMAPADRLQWMCSQNQTVYQAQAGKMVILSENPQDCNDAFIFAKSAQSWHGDWFLWSDIKCTTMEVLIH